MKQIIKPLLTLAILFVVLIFLGGCASTSSNYDSSPGDITNLDDLLGLGSEDESIGEDDVMQLLGIAEEAASDAVFDSESQIAAPDELKQEMNTLETQHSDLDFQTKQLQNKISNQENQIVALEKSVSQQPAISPVSPASQSGYATEYQDAFMLYKSKRYKDAIQKFEALLSKDSTNKLSDNAQYWIAECYYGMANYQKAIASFEKVFIYTDSNKDDAAQLKIGMSYLRLNDQTKAREELQKLINNYPTSESVSLARRLLDQVGAATP